MTMVRAKSGEVKGGDLAYALRLLASAGRIDDVWKEAGYPSRKAMADAIFRLAEGLAREAIPAGRLSVVAYADGGSSGNPGHAGCGALLKDPTGAVLVEAYRYLGETTNNVAEYHGAILALEKARELGASAVELRVDSSLLVNQIKGGYRVKSPQLAGLYRNLKERAEQFDKFDVTLIGRADNQEADRLANLAIASRGDSGRSRRGGRARALPV